MPWLFLHGLLNTLPVLLHDICEALALFCAVDLNLCSPCSTSLHTCHIGSNHRQAVEPGSYCASIAMATSRIAVHPVLQRNHMQSIPVLEHWVTLLKNLQASGEHLSAAALPSQGIPGGDVSNIHLQRSIIIQLQCLSL